jgi:3'-5' exonuclease
MYPSASEILFIDIETVPQYSEFKEAPPQIRSEWERKSQIIGKSSGLLPEDLYEKAGIYAEFGKIICISSSWFDGNVLNSMSHFGDDEKKLLNEFAELVNRFFSKGQKRLCAHNGKEFDFPYIGRRMLVNGVSLPEPFRIAGKKPWEIKHLDTMELWKFGDHKNYTSLNLLASVFGLPSPKNDIDGSQVGAVYWETGDLERIERYCRQDAETVAKLYVRLAPSQPSVPVW